MGNCDLNSNWVNQNSMEAKNQTKQIVFTKLWRNRKKEKNRVGMGMLITNIKQQEVEAEKQSLRYLEDEAVLQIN